MQVCTELCYDIMSILHLIWDPVYFKPTLAAVFLLRLLHLSQFEHFHLKLKK